MNQEELIVLNSLLLEKLPLLLEELNVQLTESSTLWGGKCLHDGADNVGALTIYKNTGYWICHTRACNKLFKPSLIGFVRMALSAGSSQNIFSFKKTLEWIVQFLKLDIKKIGVNTNNNKEKTDFNRLVSNFVKRNTPTNALISNLELKKKLKIPPEYLLRRGYKGENLCSRTIGLCDNPKKPFFNHVIFPLLCQKKQYVNGCLGRITYPKCENCASYHAIGYCGKYSSAKWKNFSKVPIKNFLYNYWEAEASIKATGVCCITEGPLDALRLIDNGIPTVVALFGSSLTDAQSILLESSGALTLCVLTDMDDAGRRAAADIAERCKNDYKILIPTYSQKDIGELNPDEINRHIKPFTWIN